MFLGLPNVYQLYRVRLIGNELPDPGSLAIASQWQFVGLAVEVFQEATVLAVFFFPGSRTPVLSRTVFPQPGPVNHTTNVIVVRWDGPW